MFYKNSKLSKKAIAALLAGSMVLNFTGCGNDDNQSTTSPTNTGTTGQAANANSVNYGLTDNVRDGSIIQAWCWDFKTIEENLSDLAAAGFTGVQTSPINACLDPGGMALSSAGGTDKGMWYYHYQPVDWTIGNYQLGTKEEFTSMCQAADKYGIKIIVDVSPNHTASTTAVSENLINAAGGLDKLYHPNYNKTITNYSDRLQSTSYAMGGLADVDTENSGFQDYFIKFLNECVDCGADGFRFDTAKHIALPDDPVAVEGETNNFWPRVNDETKNRDNIFMYGEILQGDNERLSDYVKYLDGSIASNYGGVVRGIAHNKNMDASRILDFKATNVDASKLVTWVESHDNYANDGTYRLIDNDEVAFGWAVIASIGNGTPLFYSRPVGATSEQWYGTINLVGVKGDENYKNPIVVASNRFRYAMVGEDVEATNIDTDKKILMIKRGDKGVVILNGSDTDFDVNTAVSLSDGTYTDRTGLNGDFTVSGGTLTGKIASNGVAVLYNDGYIDIPELATADIDITDNTLYGNDATVKLSATNAVTAQYSLTYADENNKFDIHSSTKTDYKDGDTITPAKDLTDGQSVILKLYVTNQAGITSTRVYRLYMKQSIKSGDKISFIASKTWSTPIYAYIFYTDENGEKKELAPWPGTKMTNDEGLTYSYTFTQDLKTANVIFTDGTNKNPANDDGKVVVPGTTY